VAVSEQAHVSHPVSRLTPHLELAAMPMPQHEIWGRRNSSATRNRLCRRSLQCYCQARVSEGQESRMTRNWSPSTQWTDTPPGLPMAAFEMSAPRAEVYSLKVWFGGLRRWSFSLLTHKRLLLCKSCTNRRYTGDGQVAIGPVKWCERRS
jgi:hypothetical protein